jgi:hypothetical protein
MSYDQAKRPSNVDADLEREIRKGRKFTLSEAIGRMAGPGMMKGVSPITGMDQARAEIKDYFEHHLDDPTAALAVVLFRGVETSELFLDNYGQPLVVLARYIQQILDSEYRLKELVRESDLEWGRMFGERPLFDKEGCSPDPRDPYTIESVRKTLVRLIEELPASNT